MPIDPLVVIVVAVVALIVATTVAHRTGEHADRRAGRYHVAEAAHGTAAGPFGPVLDVLDRSVAAYTIRSALGLSTETRQERRIAVGHAAAVARADEIRRARPGPPGAYRPRRIVVSGTPTPRVATAIAAQRSTVSVELLAAGLGLVVVIGIVIGIWPRASGESGGVLAETGVPAIATPSPTPSPSASAEATPS